MVEHLLAAPPLQTFSRLSLAVVAGVLQSLVEGTPHRLGHTYLREFHSLVRPPGLGTGVEPYYTKCGLTDVVRKVLGWWRTFLNDGRGRYVRVVALCVQVLFQLERTCHSQTYVGSAHTQK
jgi:hypothetical protein